MTCSVLILTLNEANNITDCIRSANFSDDIVVFDSHSQDDTVALAQAAGARVHQHEFESYGAQREAARTSVDYKYPWVLALDADERVDTQLAKELPTRLPTLGDNIAALRLRRKDMFRGKWIRRATLYPSWHLRVYRHARISYSERAVHEYPDVDGDIDQLEGHLIHHNFSKGVAQWWRRHIQYAEMEAKEIRRAVKSGRALPPVSSLWSDNPVERRRFLKALSYRLPFRPELRYFYMMAARGAVLDGPAGWEYCKMIAEYQRITDQIVRDEGQE